MVFTRRRHLVGLALAISRVRPDVSPAQSIFTIPDAEGYTKLSIEELTKQIRPDKFDQILPVFMRKHGIDMWIHVMREGNVHAFGTVHLHAAGFDRRQNRLPTSLVPRWCARHRERSRVLDPTAFEDPSRSLMGKLHSATKE